MKQPWEIAYQLVEARTPFLHQGRTINGIDCTGILAYTALALGYQIQDPKAYSREPGNGLLRMTLLRNGCVDVPRETPRVNDILLMQLTGQAEEGHVGIVAPHPEGLGVIHAYFSSKRVVYQRLDEVRLAQIRGIFSWPVKD